MTIGASELVGVTVTVTSGAVTVTVVGAAQTLPDPPEPAFAVLDGNWRVTKLVETAVEKIVVVGPPLPPALADDSEPEPDPDPDPEPGVDVATTVCVGLVKEFQLKLSSSIP